MTKRTSLGDRLYLVGSRYYIRVAVPKDLKKHFESQGRSPNEVFETLKTGDIREARIRCRARGAEIDAEFEYIRRSLREDASDVTEQEIERVASTLYAKLSEFHRQKKDELLNGASTLEPSSAVDIIEDMGDWWSAGLSEGVWVGKVNDTVQTLLSKAGLVLAEGSPEFVMARQRIARAVLAAHVDAAEILMTGRVEHPYSPEPVKGRSDVTLTVSGLIDKYANDPKRKRLSKKTVTGYTVIFNALEELIGPSKPVNEVTREDCRRVRDVLMKLPPNATKRFPGLTMEQAGAKADELDLPRISTTTVNSYLNNLASLFNYASDEGYVSKSPAKGLTIPHTVKKKDRKQPFSLDQLNKMFKAPLYTGCENDQAGYAKAGPNVPRRGRFWVPLLSLFTGMRLNECCQLATADVKEIDGVPCIIITEDPEGDDVEDRKRVKSEAGERYVPVHPELIKIGFLAYVKKMRDSDSTTLFPELPKGVNGYYSEPFTKWFSRFLEKADAKTAKTSFHSFRHTYRDATREAELSRDTVIALGGWASQSTEDDYGSSLKPATLAKAIEKIRYPGLDLGHLYVQLEAQQ